MIAALDVQYDDSTASANCAAVVFAAWTDVAPRSERVVRTTGIAPYEPGSFYQRELPCLMAVLRALPAVPSLVVIDGYVMLGERPGLGMHLWEALGRATPVVGVAKTQFHAATARAVLRGGSRSPLFVTAVGLDVEEAAENVRAMAGPHRIPALLQRADRLARGR